MGLVECVVNISEGQDRRIVESVAAAAGPAVVDVHSDPHHNRSVLTLLGDEADVSAAARSVAEEVVRLIDITGHAGVHPRIGALDVVPWVPLGRRQDGHLGDGDPGTALDIRDSFASWAGETLSLPCFLYGPERSLPELRREAWLDLTPDTGPPAPHPTAGASAVGARPILVAYNLWLAEADLSAARRIAGEVRGPHVRCLGLPVGGHVQVSCNLISPWQVGPGAVFDAVASRASVASAELVGLVPTSVLEAEPRHRWPELGLDDSHTIEARLQMGGPRWGKI